MIDNCEFATTVSTGINLVGCGLGFISNIYHQTPTNCAIHIDGSTVFCQLINISAESNTQPVVLLDNGAKFNNITNVVQSGLGPMVTDNSAGNAINDVNYIHTGQNGKVTAPTVATGQIYNTFGTTIMAMIQIGSTATNISRQTVTVGATLTNQVVTVVLNAGECIALSQTTGVSWTWWRI